MSHFAVLVMSENHGNDLEDLLAPFDENLGVDPYVAFTREQAVKYIRDDAKRGVDVWSKRLAENPDYEDAKKYFEENRKRLEDWTDEQCYQYLREEYEDDGMIDAEGNLLSTYNPKSKWDWYSVGGRWSGSLKIWGGARDDEGYANQIDFGVDLDEYAAAIKWWEINIDERPLNDGEKKDDWMFYKPEYYKDFYHDKETYARIRSLPIFRSVITPDGEWHEKGQMGWWGMSSESGEESLDWDLHFMERFIEPAIANNWYLTVVDCHI